MYGKKGCVRIYLRISHETTISAVFWWLNVFYHQYHRFATVADVIEDLSRASNFRKRGFGPQNMLQFLDRTTMIK